MKFLIANVLIIILFILTPLVFAQDITFIPQDTLLEGNIGDVMIFYGDVTNISSVRQTVFIVRTENLPMGWYSSLCFGVCFPPNYDSIATTPEFGISPLEPGETRELELEVTAIDSNGTAYIQLQAGTFLHPNDRITVNFIATTIPVSVNDDIHNPDKYSLYQNYPNPFNPVTRINYNVGEAGLVQLKVYNILGIQVATLVNTYQISGNYYVDFDALDFPSGVYLYTLSINSFTQTRKMILEK